MELEDADVVLGFDDGETGFTVVLFEFERDFAVEVVGHTLFDILPVVGDARERLWGAVVLVDVVSDVGDVGVVVDDVGLFGQHFLDVVENRG